jgi:hypothetical protein
MAGEGVDRSGDAAEASPTHRAIPNLGRAGNLLAKAIPFGASLFGSRGGNPTIRWNRPAKEENHDWRTKLTLSSATRNLLVGSSVLRPLTATGGIIFPYTPAIFIQHSANFGASQLTHSNYDHPAFDTHTIGDLTMTGQFTANSSAEADYVLAVLHFLRTTTKMFFGQESDFPPGTPPPVLRLNGFGDHIFKNIPVVVINFNMEMPATVDYVRTTSNSGQTSMVPTSTTLAITVKPVYSRAATSQRFGLKKFATGALLGSDSEGGFI